MIASPERQAAADLGRRFRRGWNCTEGITTRNTGGAGDDKVEALFGYTLQSDTGANAFDTTNAFTTSFIHGLYSNKTGATTWSGAVTHTLPSSFFLGSKPSWWGTVPYPGIGPDITGGTIPAAATAGPSPGGHVNANPAMNCFYSVMGGKEGGDGSPYAFNATLCYAPSAVQLSPVSLAFGNVVLNVTSSALSTTLTNTGNTILNISTITLSGANAAMFTISANTCGSTLATSATCSVSVTFTPTTAGAKTASLVFTTDASTSPDSVALTGTGIGPAVTLTPGSLSFGDQPVNTTSGSQSTSLQNTGTSTLHITSIAIGGTDSSMFAITSSTCGASSIVNATCSVSANFTPLALAARSASIVFTTDAATSPDLVALTGTGRIPAMFTGTGNMLGTIILK